MFNNRLLLMNTQIHISIEITLSIINNEATSCVRNDGSSCYDKITQRSNGKFMEILK